MKYTKLKTALFSTLLLSSALLANDNPLFVGVATGYSNLSIEETNTQGVSVDKTGYNYALEAGYAYTKEIELTLNYQRVILNAISLNNTYVGINYKLEKLSEFTPYLGVNAGYSTLHWDKNPIKSTKTDLTSGSYFFGVEAGVFYSLAENLDFKLSYDLQRMDHTTHISTNGIAGELHNNLSHHFNVGVRYSF